MNATGGSAKELDGLLGRSPIAMLLADDARRYVDVNDAACELLGLDRATLLEAGVDGLHTSGAARARAGHVGALPRAGAACKASTNSPTRRENSCGSPYLAIARVLPGRHLSCLTAPLKA